MFVYYVLQEKMCKAFELVLESAKPISEKITFVYLWMLLTWTMILHNQRPQTKSNEIQGPQEDALKVPRQGTSMEKDVDDVLMENILPSSIP